MAVKVYMHYIPLYQLKTRVGLTIKSTRQYLISVPVRGTPGGGKMDRLGKDPTGFRSKWVSFMSGSLRGCLY